MANTFRFVGKLSLAKETEKFKPVVERVSAKGWVSRTIKFSLGNNTGFHNLEMFDGFMNNGQSTIYCLGAEKGADGKYPKMQVKWAERFNEEVVAKVASFNKYKFKTSEVEREFLTGYDLQDEVLKLLNDEKSKDRRFMVEGEIQYSEWNGNTYKKYVPKSITEVNADAADESIATLDIYFGKDSLDTSIYAETKKYIVNGFVRQYDSSLKKEIPFAEELVIDTSKATNEKQEKMFDLIKKRFEVTGENFMKSAIKCVVVNGVEKVAITMDDLDESDKELIEFGLATFEEIAREMGGSMNGNRVSETKVVGFGFGYTRQAKFTDYTAEDFIREDVSNELIGEESKPTEVVEDDFDLDSDLPF